MKEKKRFINWLGIWLIAVFLPVGDISADTLFSNRRIHLSNDDNRVFSIGITGTTAGYNYIALVEKAKQESISLGDLGYWELVPDPPSFLRNYDLQMIIENSSKGNFQIEFEYDKKSQSIGYKVKEGAIEVKIDDSDYYPKLIIKGIASIRTARDLAVVPKGEKRVLFYDFNSFDVDLRKYYGRVKRLLRNKDYSQYFYYYESGNYNSYYFKAYQKIANLDTDKMGLSQEDGTLEYYQRVLDNLKSRFGSEFADQIIIVSRFGNRHSKELKGYASAIGLSREMVVTFLSYDDIK